MKEDLSTYTPPEVCRLNGYLNRSLLHFVDPIRVSFLPDGVYLYLGFLLLEIATAPPQRYHSWLRKPKSMRSR